MVHVVSIDLSISYFKMAAVGHALNEHVYIVLATALLNILITPNFAKGLLDNLKIKYFHNNFNNLPFC